MFLRIEKNFQILPQKKVSEIRKQIIKCYQENHKFNIISFNWLFFTYENIHSISEVPGNLFVSFKHIFFFGNQNQSLESILIFRCFIFFEENWWDEKFDIYFVTKIDSRDVGNGF
jgi:hypothetical protein